MEIGREGANLRSMFLRVCRFYIGSNVMNWPKQAQRGLSDGHQLAVHTWSHQSVVSSPTESLALHTTDISFHSRLVRTDT